VGCPRGRTRRGGWWTTSACLGWRDGLRSLASSWLEEEGCSVWLFPRVARWLAGDGGTGVSRGGKRLLRCLARSRERKEPCLLIEATQGYGCRGGASGPQRPCGQHCRRRWVGLARMCQGILVGVQTGPGGHGPRQVLGRELASETWAGPHYSMS
jgi:hypothetical protein